MNKTDDKPFLGLTLKGEWRDCQAMSIVQENGSTVLEESELCQKSGVPQDGLELWLATDWTEHNIHAVLEGIEQFTEGNVSLVRQYDGYFKVRLFSPFEELKSKWAENSKSSPSVM